MTLADIVANYRLLNLQKKVALVIFLALFPGIYTYFDAIPDAEEARDSALVQRHSSEEKLEAARRKKDQIPDLEANMLHTQQRLTEVSKQLPDQFELDKVLEVTAMLAQDLGLELGVFDPGEPFPAGGLYKYIQLPIAVSIIGTYQKLALFFDRIAHLNLLVQLKEIDLTASDKRAGNATIASRTDNQEEAARRARSDARIEAKTELLIFRTPTAAEEQALAAADAAAAASAAAAEAAAQKEKKAAGDGG